MSSTLDKIIQDSTEETTFLEELGVNEAQSLTNQLHQSLENTIQLYIKAWRHRIWKTLGYANWNSYINGEFGDIRPSIPKAERQEAVIQMTESGMSKRSIASAIGVSKDTANRYAQKAREEKKLSSETLIYGMDGRRRLPVRTQLNDDLLDMPADAMGIGYFSQKDKNKPASKPQVVHKKPRETENTYGLAEVEKNATEYEEAIKASILANDRRKFNTNDIPLHLVTATSRSLLATAGLINLFNLQPDLTGDNDEIIKTLESTVQTLDNAIDSLRGADE
ncbi:hypothetical protein [Rothia dentocariosa]|uniref:hypothetical protein n=1 Tax=Rothia dentocariosa TaxID=2047 RepID=UPI00065FDA1E|nr:hypothetical protein [Rothia dentocariosa]